VTWWPADLHEAGRRPSVSGRGGRVFPLWVINLSNKLPSELNAPLETISTALSSTISVLSPPNGLSLLDLENNLLLSHIQNLALVILSKLTTKNFTLNTPASEAIIWNLIEDCYIHLKKEFSPLKRKSGIKSANFSVLRRNPLCRPHKM
jgi:hypothetical protein